MGNYKRKERPGFLCYHDSKPLVDILSDDDAGKLFKSLYGYSVDGITAQFDGTLGATFQMMSKKIEEGANAWQHSCDMQQMRAIKRCYPDWFLDGELLPEHQADFNALIEKNAVVNRGLPWLTEPTKQNNTNLNETKQNNASASPPYVKGTKPYLLSTELHDLISERLSIRESEDKILETARYFYNLKKYRNQTYKRIEQIIFFSQENDFWKKAVIDGESFKRNYKKMLAQCPEDYADD